MAERKKKKRMAIEDRGETVSDGARDERLGEELKSGRWEKQTADRKAAGS